jgi:hypothetical protein
MVHMDRHHILRDPVGRSDLEDGAREQLWSPRGEADDTHFKITAL